MVSKKEKGQQSHMLPRKARKEANTPGFEQNGIPPTSSKEAPVFFWKEDGDSGWLCQWYRCTFTDPETGMKFTSTEQWMMYHKAMEFDDLETAAQIMKTTSPRKQKGLAKQVANFDEERWYQVRSGIVERGNWLKFTQGTNLADLKIDDEGEPVALRDMLLATGDRELAEASPFDRIWGIGYKADEALRVPRVQWGENLLGKALMKVRDRLQLEGEDCAVSAV